MKAKLDIAPPFFIIRLLVGYRRGRKTKASRDMFWRFVKSLTSQFCIKVKNKFKKKKYLEVGSRQQPHAEETVPKEEESDWLTASHTPDPAHSVNTERYTSLSHTVLIPHSITTNKRISWLVYLRVLLRKTRSKPVEI